MWNSTHAVSQGSRTTPSVGLPSPIPSRSALRRTTLLCTRVPSRQPPRIPARRRPFRRAVLPLPLHARVRYTPWQSRHHKVRHPNSNSRFMDRKRSARGSDVRSSAPGAVLGQASANGRARHTLGGRDEEGSMACPPQRPPHTTTRRTCIAVESGLVEARRCPLVSVAPGQRMAAWGRAGRVRLGEG